MKKFLVAALAVMFIAAFTVPAGAVETKLDGVLFLDVMWLDADAAFQQNTMGNANDADWDAMHVDINPFGYVGFQIKGETTGLRVNWAPRGRSNKLGGEPLEEIRIRQFYAYWDVNPMFRIIAGQLASKHSTLNPNCVAASTAVESDNTTRIQGAGLGYGNIFPRRHPQVQGNFKFNKMATLQVAVIHPETESFTVYDPNATINQANGQASDETTFPRVDVTLEVNWGPLMVAPSYSYLQKDYEWDQFFGANTTWDNEITVWNFALPVQFGYKGLGVKAELNIGENWGSGNMYYQGTWVAPSTDRAVVDVNGKIHDTDCTGFWVDVTYKFGKFIPGIWYGWQEHENTGLPAADAARRFESDRDAWGIYLMWKAAPHWTITPFYFSYDMQETNIDGRDDQIDYGEWDVYGVNFIVAF
jgi:hypothetical protein